MGQLYGKPGGKSKTAIIIQYPAQMSGQAIKPLKKSLVRITSGIQMDIFI